MVTVAEASLKRRAGLARRTVAALKRGTEVGVIADRGVWIQARAGSKTGYVPADEVERESDREAREERAKKILSFPAVYGVVAEETPVLLAPFPFAPRAGSLAKGTSIPIHAVDHAYFAYADKANGVAFVASADVDLVPPDPKVPNIVPDSTVRLRRLETVDLSPPTPTPVESAMPPALPPEAFPPGGAPAPASSPGGGRGRHRAGRSRLEGGPDLPGTRDPGADRGQRRSRRRHRRNGSGHRRSGDAGTAVRLSDAASRALSSSGGIAPPVVPAGRSRRESRFGILSTLRAVR